MTDIPPYQGASAASGAMTCPKCIGQMRTVDRNGVHIEQCLNCRGVFLDFGELESITQLESRMMGQQLPPQGYGVGPAWGSYGGHHYRRRGFGSLFFST